MKKRISKASLYIVALPFLVCLHITFMVWLISFCLLFMVKNLRRVEEEIRRTKRIADKVGVKTNESIYLNFAYWMRLNLSDVKGAYKELTDNIF